MLSLLLSRDSRRAIHLMLRVKNEIPLLGGYLHLIWEVPYF